MSKILGIVGGMGPLASVDLQLRIIQNTLAKTDAEHLHVITDCNGKILIFCTALVSCCELLQVVGSQREQSGGGRRRRKAASRESS